MKPSTTKKRLNRLCAALLLIILAGIGVGFFFRLTDQVPLGDKFIGGSILIFVIILLPVFLVYRWKGKKLKDYTLTKENMDRMRDRGID